MTARITVIGLNPDDPSALTDEARRVLAEAAVLAGGERQLALFPEHPAQRVVLASNVTAQVRQLRGERIVVLASGDPLLYGIGATLVRELGRDQVRILPAVSSVALAFARLGVPWHDATVLSAHGRPLEGIVPAALASAKLAVLTDDRATPPAIAQALIAAGMEDCRAAVCERLGEPGERILNTTLHALPGQRFDRLNVLVLLREPEAPRLVFGRPDEDFESVRGQVTKAEVRAVALARLRLPPAGVLWDVGAGSGALAIEAARLMPRGAVYAIERDPEQRACLARNVERHSAHNVHVVEGEAPEALPGLPRPGAVFLGGSGGRLAELLEALPRPFVANLAVLEHVNTVLQRFPTATLTQLSVSRSSPIGGGHRLASLNPVFIVEVPA
jgi:precorrin-6Y C5,15-methyltransferase (decarboxylating)